MNTVSIEETHFVNQHMRLDSQNVETNALHWAAVDLDGVRTNMPRLERYGAASMAVLEPLLADVDETQTHVIAYECGKGYTPDAYIRAKAYQQLVAPNARVVMLPGNSGDAQLVGFDGFSDKERRRMADGNFTPYGELLVDALERADKRHDFGDLYVNGYSMGGLSALAIAAAGSSSLIIRGLNVIEAPSKEGRGRLGLGLDLAKSAGNFDRVFAESHIPALQELFDKEYTKRDGKNFCKFVLATKSGRLLVRGMTGSASELLESALDQLPDDSGVTLQFFEGSKVFDPDSLTLRQKRETRIILHRAGPELPQSQKHASANHPGYHAAMAHDAFYPARPRARNRPAAFKC